MASSFSGKAGRKASIDAENYIGTFRTDLLNRDAADRATSAKQVKAGTDAVKSNYGKALTDLQTYYPEQQGYYDKALAGYEPLAAEAKAGVDMYGNAMGLHGAAGSAAALDAFRGANPGYEFQRNQAEDAVMRRANAGGMLTSGNMLTELSDRTQGLADSTYGSYVDRLQPYLTTAGNVANAQAGIYGAKAGAAAQMGAGSAAIRTGMGDKLLQAGEFNAGQTGQYNQIAQAGMLDLGSQQVAAHTSGMMAGQEAAKNRMSAIMGGVGLAAQIAGMGVSGGGTVGGNFLSGIFK